MHAKKIIEKFGGQSALAALLGKGQSTVAYWAKTGSIPSKWQATLLRLAVARGVELSADDFVTDLSLQQATQKSSKNNTLVTILPSSMAAPPGQAMLDLGVVKQVEIDGVGLGVLSDGTPFLTGRGLARLAGVAHSVIQSISTEWNAETSFPRAKKIREILSSHGEKAEVPYYEIRQRSGVLNAYPDSVCLAILEYYAFDAGGNIRDEAKRNYRLLAGKALREFIYTQVGYDPKNSVPNEWHQFHDRVSLTYNSLPAGYFGIFKEIADLIVTLGQAGLHIDATFVPDISVGQHWARHWAKEQLSLTYGERIKYEHNYPTYFPQSDSNPQEPWCYPEQALGEFRRWFREQYMRGGKFAAYIEPKLKERALPVSFAQLAVAAYVRD